MKQTPGRDYNPSLHPPHLSSATLTFDPDSCPGRGQHTRGGPRHLAELPFTNMIFRMICPGALVVVRPDESVCSWQGFR